MQMNRVGLLNILPEPTTIRAIIRIAKLATTNAPITAGLTRLPMTAYRIASLLSASEKISHSRIFRMRKHVMRIAGRDLNARFRVQEDAVIGDGEDAGELV